MHYSEQNSIENDNRIKQLQKKREAIQKQTEMRRKEIEQYSDLDYEKIQKENEILIQDKYNVEQRAAKLQEVYNGLKLSVMKQVGKIQVSADALCKHKQNIYEHMVRHKSKEADLFLLTTNTKPKDYFQVLEDNLNQGPLVQEKEKEMEALKLQNQILKNELEIHKNQQQYIREFSNNPHIDQDIIKNMVNENQFNRINTSKNERSNSQLSMETKQIMDFYNEKQQTSSMYKEQLQFG
ncbi:unnamed protein product [Paramecium primaurelia]|uniref:Uncharacterized protein n=1 Tax=Paramecium primaurelia TaxID=5886 RepID=A0A8S1MSE0_PARPR|nr:unnamed protein product [Paramecium primaurelia]